MDLQSYIDEIKLKITGGILDLEIEDSVLEKLVNASFREVQRYIATTKLATLPYTHCIDLSDCHVSSISRVFRTQGYLGDTNKDGVTLMADPMQAAQWQMLAGSGSMLNFNSYVYDYAAWNTLMQVRNTTSTDLAFKFDKSTSKLYINTCYNNPDLITIEYVPRYDSVEEIVSDYWIDIILRLAVALTKVTLGRIRSRYTQNDSPWQQDGEKLLEEGNTELQELREKLEQNNQLCYPVD